MQILGKKLYMSWAKGMFGYYFQADKKYNVCHLNKFCMERYMDSTFAVFDIRWLHIEKHKANQIIYMVDSNLSKFERYLSMLNMDNYIAHIFWSGCNSLEDKNLHICNHWLTLYLNRHNWDM